MKRSLLALAAVAATACAPSLSAFDGATVGVDGDGARRSLVVTLLGDAAACPGLDDGVAGTAGDHTLAIDQAHKTAPVFHLDGPLQAQGSECIYPTLSTTLDRGDAGDAVIDIQEGDEALHIEVPHLLDRRLDSTFDARIRAGEALDLVPPGGLDNFALASVDADPDVSVYDDGDAGVLVVGARSTGPHTLTVHALAQPAARACDGLVDCYVDGSVELVWSGTVVVTP